MHFQQLSQGRDLFPKRVTGGALGTGGFVCGAAAAVICNSRWLSVFSSDLSSAWEENPSSWRKIPAASVWCEQLLEAEGRRFLSLRADWCVRLVSEGEMSFSSAGCVSE